MSGSTTQPTPDGYLTIAQAAERLGVSRQAVHLRVKSGQLDAKRDDSHPLWRWLIAESDLLAGAS